MLRNLFYIFNRYRLASVFNIVGLCLAFFFFMVVLFHQNYEYGFDRNIAGREHIYQMENMRDDGIWDANFSRPMAETILNSSSLIEQYGLSTQSAYSAVSKMGFSTSAGTETDTYIYEIEQITPEYARLFGFDIIDGSIAALENPCDILISESASKALFGQADPVGKAIYASEFRGLPSVSGLPVSGNTPLTVGGVFRDFPENSRLTNSIYLPISKSREMDDWSTCRYYCYVKFGSKEAAETMIQQFAANNKDLLLGHGINELRLRPVTELYFGTQARNDAAPTGSKTLTDILFLIAIMIVVIALANYINFSVALAPVRAKSVTVRKVLGSNDVALRCDLLFESLVISVLAFLFAFLFLFLFKDYITTLLGHPIDIATYWTTPVWTCAVAILGGILSGLYPAFYITSFPAIKALNGTFSLSSRSRVLRKGLIGFQFIISIALVCGSLFVVLQNRFINRYEMGFDHDNVLEVKLSMGTALSQSENFRSMLLKYSEIKEVAFCQIPFVTDMIRPLIGYNYNGHHSYMSWTGVSSQLPELLDIKIIHGRRFRPSDQLGGNMHPVCIINESAAKEILSWFSADEIGSIEDLVGTYIYDNDTPVEIVGIARNVHYESLYKPITPLAFWTASREHYRSMAPGNFAYVKVADDDPSAAIRHIRDVADELNPGYPVEVRFFDQSIEDLYTKSHKQGILVALLSLIAVILSLVGVFGMAIYEAKRMKKEIAIRKVWGATVPQILQLFSIPILKIILISAIISIPLACYGVYVWLKGFAYHIDMYWWVFVLATLAVVLTALATITYQNYRAAGSNPIDSIKFE